MWGKTPIRCDRATQRREGVVPRLSQKMASSQAIRPASQLSFMHYRRARKNVVPTNVSRCSMSASLKVKSESRISAEPGLTTFS